MVLDFIQRPDVQVRGWGLLTLLWIVLTPVTMLTFLRGSIPWVAFMSLFALVASCGTAYVAALAYRRAESADRKADHVIEHHPDIPAVPR